MNKFKKSEIEIKGDSQANTKGTETELMSRGIPSDSIVNIDMDLIVPNKLNDFSMSELEELAELIYVSNGIWQPLILKPDRNPDGTYTLTTGERRWRAARIARDNGKYPKNLQNTVPCVFKDPKELDIPLSDESKELFSIMLTNQYRHKNEADQITEVRNWKRIFGELREGGEKYIPEKLAVLAGRARYDEEGEYIPEVLAGQKTKELVASHMKISQGKYQQINTLDKSASKELMDKLMKNEVSFSAAEKVLEMPEGEQKRFLEETQGMRVEAEAVARHIEEREEKVPLTKVQLSSDLELIIEEFPKDGIDLGSKEMKRYLNYLKQIKKILGKDEEKA